MVKMCGIIAYKSNGKAKQVIMEILKKLDPDKPRNLAKNVTVK